MQLFLLGLQNFRSVKLIFFMRSQILKMPNAFKSTAKLSLSFCLVTVSNVYMFLVKECILSPPVEFQTSFICLLQ